MTLNQHSLSLVHRSLANPASFARIVTKEAWGWKNLDLWQADVLNFTDRFLLLNCSRQSGKSSTLMVKALYTALVKPKALVLVVAEQRQSNEDVRKARELLKGYGDWLDRRFGKKITVTVITDNKTSFELAHGSRIIALPANEKVRGYSAPDLVIMDEAAYLDDLVFVGIDPMLEVSRGQMILASTPNGTTGFYYREFHNPRYKVIRVPWMDCPRINPESIKQKRILYGEAYVKQEYETHFLDDISSLFTEQALQASLDDSEEVFDGEMLNIQKVLQGDVELV